MDRFGIRLHLEHIRAARDELNKKRREYDAIVNKHLPLLLLEAGQNRMSVREVSKHSGIPVRQIRARLKKLGVKSTDARLLPDASAKVLAANADLLNIDPADMDLMSPLAYLPAGQALRDLIKEED